MERSNSNSESQKGLIAILLAVAIVVLMFGFALFNAEKPKDVIPYTPESVVTAYCGDKEFQLVRYRFTVARPGPKWAYQSLESGNRVELKDASCHFEIKQVLWDWKADREAIQVKGSPAPGGTLVF